MKIIGYIIITFGFLAGTLACVVNKEEIYWGYFIVSVLAGSVGIGFVHFGERKQSRSEEKLATNIKSIEDSLSRVVENIKQLNREKKSIDTYDVRHRIDELFIDDLEMSVDARESIGHRYSLAAYGEIMSTFAAGERYLNRVWSASADGYIDEVSAYLDKAQEQFVDSLEKIRSLKINQTNTASSG